MSSSAPITRDELPYRLRQQALLGAFGRHALQTRDLGELLRRAAELCAQGLETELCKILEYLPGENVLLVRAGVGWAPGTVGSATLGADLGSPAGYAFHTGTAVISNHLQGETRFRTPRLLAEHGVKRAINVLIEAGHGSEPGRSFGVLEVDSRDEGQFDRADAEFLTGFAGLIGVAIGRQQADARLRQALDTQALLTREMSHRVKNSLAMVAGLLRVQVRTETDERVQHAISDAETRIAAIARMHDQLWRSLDVRTVDLGTFLEELCAGLEETAPQHRLVVETVPILLPADLALPIGLLVNELVTNAFKYAYPEGHPGEVRVRLAMGENKRLRLSVEDDGTGLPEDFTLDHPGGSLGLRLIKTLVGQLEATLKIERRQPGTCFLVEIPHQAA